MELREPEYEDHFSVEGRDNVAKLMALVGF